MILRDPKGVHKNIWQDIEIRLASTHVTLEVMQS